MPPRKGDPQLNRKALLRAVPGWIASLAMIALTTFWTYWGVAEMFHEGWWGAWYNRLPYLAPIIVCLIPTLVALRWPIAGGAVILSFGILGGWFFENLFFIFLTMGSIGGLFIVDGLLRRRSTPGIPTTTGKSVPGGPAPHTELINSDTPNGPVPSVSSQLWWRRNLRYLLACGLPCIVALGISAARLPIVLRRTDDGDRSARRIDGNGVSLIWAPEGPGWNYKQPWGGYPSWQSVALYGVEPVGFSDKVGYGRQEDHTVFASPGDMATTNVCRFLTPDGLSLADTPQDIWRMPTADELVRSLTRYGMNAGCMWNGQERVETNCEIRPDKESPLWATDHAAIYYWAANEYDEREGYFVSYNGWVQAAHKLGGNPRHSYRCVRQPD